MPKSISAKNSFVNATNYAAANANISKSKKKAKASSAKAAAQDIYEGVNKVAVEPEEKSQKTSLFKKKRTYVLGTVGAAVLGFAGYGLYALAPKIAHGVGILIHSSPLAVPILATVGVSVAVVGVALGLMFIYNRRKLKQLEKTLEEKNVDVKQIINEARENKAAQSQQSSANSSRTSTMQFGSASVLLDPNNNVSSSKSKVKAATTAPQFNSADIEDGFDFNQWKI